MTSSDRIPAIVLLVALAIGAVAWCGEARGHDQYMNWQRPDVGGPCCHGVSEARPDGDCRPTTAYKGDDGLWRAGPRELVVPANKLVPRAPDGRCHVCERGGYVLCFAPCDTRA